MKKLISFIMIIGCGIICYAQICLSSIMTELEAIYHNVWEPKTSVLYDENYYRLLEK